MKMQDFASVIVFRTKNSDYRLSRQNANDTEWTVERIKDNKVVDVYENMTILKMDLFEVAFLQSDSKQVMTTPVLEIWNNMYK